MFNSRINKLDCKIAKIENIIKCNQKSNSEFEKVVRSFCLDIIETSGADTQTAERLRNKINGKDSSACYIVK